VTVVSQKERKQAELLTCVGEQFTDSTIPAEDPLPDVDSEATAMLEGYSITQSPHHRASLALAAAAAPAAASASVAVVAAGTVQVPAGNSAASTGLMGRAGTQKDPPLDLTRRRPIFDLTSDALLPLQSKMPETDEAVERWERGLALRQLKILPPGDGPSGNSASGAVSGALVRNVRKLAPNPWTLAALKPKQKKKYPCTQCGRGFDFRSDLR
jgi:hypothetical protein